MTHHWAPSRRRFLQGSAAVGAAAIAMPLGTALGAGYPEQNIDVVIPTREGGGADRNFRAFTSLWKTYLNTNFEPGFYPGASGRVGYEVFMGKKEADCYNLIFGNMGPEVLNWVVKAPTFDLNDYLYFGRVDTDPGCVGVCCVPNGRTAYRAKMERGPLRGAVAIADWFFALDGKLPCRGFAFDCHLLTWESGLY